MTLNARLLGAAAAGAIALAASPAFAAGTTAGATITNTVTVNYQVGGVAQTAQSASNSVTVDRKVNLTMTGAGTTTSVVPGQTSAVTTYILTNTSNDTLDFQLTASQQSGGTAVHGGTDIFDTTNTKIYVDTNNDGVFNAGDTLVTYIDELAADTSKTLFIVSDVPIAQVNGQVAGVVLAARAEIGGTAGTQGALLTATTGANTSGIDTVFADGAGATDSANDGIFSARGDYTVSAPVLTITKVSTLISDPVSGTTNPKAIPGAVIEYCIIVSNGAGAATATNLAVSDPLPGTTTYSSTYGIFLNGTASGSICAADGTAGGTYTAGTTTVAGTLANLAAGATETLRFRATIN